MFVHKRCHDHFYLQNRIYDALGNVCILQMWSNQSTILLCVQTESKIITNASVFAANDEYGKRYALAIEVYFFLSVWTRSLCLALCAASRVILLHSTFESVCWNTTIEHIHKHQSIHHCSDCGSFTCSVEAPNRITIILLSLHCASKHIQIIRASAQHNNFVSLDSGLVIIRRYTDFVVECCCRLLLVLLLFDSHLTSWI